MIFRHAYRDGVWVDLEQPTGEEIRDIAHEFSINERFEAELLSPTPTPRVLADADVVLFVLHLPSNGPTDGETENQEIDFVVGKNFIVTAHYELVEPLHKLKKLLETQELVGGATQVTTEVLLEILFAHFYTSVRDVANHRAHRLTRVETAMFNSHERATIQLISNISREFLHMEAVLVNQEELLEDFLVTLAEHKFFTPAFGERSERMLRERTQVARLVATHRAVATELRETNSALLEARQNEIMKTLTVINFILLPLGLISWIFAMRTEGMPLIDSPNSFWIVLGIMAVVALSMIFFFARKRWFT